MEKLRACKPSYEKENQQKYVNKKTDLLSSLHNIKLPLQPSNFNSEASKFQSVPITSSLIVSVGSPNLLTVRDKPVDSPKKELSQTQEYLKMYGAEVEQVFAKEMSNGKFLSEHKIDGILRARMLDWMVEVMSSYNFQHKTYFAGVEIMDKYFANSVEAILPNQLHIIGVQSMFVASKMEEVYPLKMKTIFDKIAHKKIPVSELVNMEKKIVETLNFCLTSSTFFDLAMTRIVKQLCRTDTYSAELVKDIEDVCSCLAKYMSYNYTMVCLFDKKTLANTLSNFVLSIYKLDRPSASSQE